MTRDIFEEWLKDLNSKMCFDKRKILLFIDNATVHSDIELLNARILFFPPNATSHLLHYFVESINKLGFSSTSFEDIINVDVNLETSDNFLNET